MKVLLIQVVLIAVVAVVVTTLFRSRGARSQAIRRVGLLLFGVFAAVSILFPSVWNRIAVTLGVGRGTDMVLYALVVAFLSYVVTSYLRFRDLETRYTKLARRVALDEAGRPPGGHPPEDRPS
jgi:hypothetical protein